MLGKLQKTAVQLIYVCLLCQVYGEASPTVCIVGSGISGATTAYFTRQLDDNVSIKVFEKESNIGGRIQHFSHNNKTIEAGGSVIHCKNRYMLIIAQELGLEILRTSEEKFLQHLPTFWMAKRLCTNLPVLNGWILFKYSGVMDITTCQV